MRLTSLIILLTICIVNAYDTSAQSGKTELQSTENTYFNSTQLEPSNKVELFPNPVEDFLQVQILNSTLVNLRFEMHSIIGNVIQIETEEVGNDTYHIPVEGLTSGYYFLVIKDDETRFNEAFKFLKRD
ncbi:MAG: T9SS type A sorting domain-containing protein [Bacteroidetes bacterium]|nr:T9SS type A sorting domain-containing protein [Bacteroidota bacterium]MDA1119683.1 T9SS type A sorting domain-containing protein [Bacteroidota bacterium]